MPEPTPEGRKLAVDVLLAEYKEQKAEITMRAQRQNQTFNYVLLVLLAVAGGTGSILGQANFPQDLPYVERILALAVAFLPLVITPLAFLFFDDELMIFESEIYILTRIKPRIRALIEPSILEILRDNDLLTGTFAWRARHLQKHFQADHSTIARPRYVLFVFPVYFAAAALAALSIHQIYKSWREPWGWLAVSLFTIGLVADVVCLRYLKKAISYATRIRKRYCDLVDDGHLGEDEFAHLASLAAPPKPARLWAILRIRDVKFRRTR